MTRAVSRLWAVTCYFNPVGSARRLQNYRVFRARLDVPLLTVEWSNEGRFELGEDDAEILVRLESPDLLWQKERLLNLAIRALPEEVDRVAWLDCDVVLERDDWPREALRLLDRYPLLQLFERFHDLSREAPPGAADSRFSMNSGDSFVVAKRVKGRGRALRELSDPGGSVRVLRSVCSGMAWAGTREVLQRHGLYDACILGGGDQAFAYAARGEHEGAVQGWITNTRQRQHYLEWADAFSRAVGSGVACLEGTIFHLWHGELRDRRYRERNRQLARFDFDPFEDIALAENGCWRWNSDKTALHAYLRRYFASRNEDGS